MYRVSIPLDHFEMINGSQQVTDIGDVLSKITDSSMVNEAEQILKSAFAANPDQLLCDFFLFMAKDGASTNSILHAATILNRFISPNYVASKADLIGFFSHVAETQELYNTVTTVSLRVMFINDFGVRKVVTHLIANILSLLGVSGVEFAQSLFELFFQDVTNESEYASVCSSCRLIMELATSQGYFIDTFELDYLDKLFKNIANQIFTLVRLKDQYLQVYLNQLIEAIINLSADIFGTQDLFSLFMNTFQEVNEIQFADESFAEVYIGSFFDVTLSFYKVLYRNGKEFRYDKVNEFIIDMVNPNRDEYSYPQKVRTMAYAFIKGVLDMEGKFFEKKVTENLENAFMASKYQDIINATVNEMLMIDNITDVEDPNENLPHMEATECLSKLIEIMPSLMCEQFSPDIPQLLNGDSWKQTHAGLLCLSAFSFNS